MIFITAKFRVLPEHADRWPEITAEFTRATRAEPGCLWFDWSRSLDDPTEYVLVEAFRDGDAGAAHVQSDALQGRAADAAAPSGRDAADREHDGAAGRLVPAGRDGGPGSAVAGGVGFSQARRTLPAPPAARDTVEQPAANSRASETVALYERAGFLAAQMLANSTWIGSPWVENGSSIGS